MTTPTLESRVLPLAESKSLVEHGIVLETVLAWYHQHCDVYEGKAPDGMSAQDWETMQGRPVVCVCAEMEDHTPICPAPVLLELLDALFERTEPIYLDKLPTLPPDMMSCMVLLEDGQNRGLHAYGPTTLQAAANLLMEMSK